jgi:hypothetical protein
MGTKPADPDVFAKYIGSLHPSGTVQRDELDNAKAREATGTTIFHRDVSDDAPIIYDYQVKGFIKAACTATNRFDKEYRNGLGKLTACRAKITEALFIKPRIIRMEMPKGLERGVCERPLIAETAQGKRVTVVRSETVPAGTVLDFEIHLFAKELLPHLKVWLNYGLMIGLGQWRNSGKGQFKWELMNPEVLPTPDAMDKVPKSEDAGEE